MSIASRKMEMALWSILISDPSSYCLHNETLPVQKDLVELSDGLGTLGDRF